ncbi:STAS-like domain-containing protein [Chryseobacterium gleum]|uniref:STAS-like domain-containing protein n=1 Tax=Chryseobacterium gleum TaxID=250 RepID=UPI0028A5BC84|nr:STAS-like domain-containing protein [Chryseobacterium gleum]
MIYNLMATLYIKDFSTTPGVRSRDEGPYSGEEFRNTILEPAIRESLKSGEKIKVVLDGTLGYATSFLEEVFGGIVRSFGYDNIKRLIEVVSIQRPYYIDDVNEYMNDAKNMGRAVR